MDHLSSDAMDWQQATPPQQQVINTLQQPGYEGTWFPATELTRALFPHHSETDPSHASVFPHIPLPSEPAQFRTIGMGKKGRTRAQRPIASIHAGDGKLRSFPRGWPKRGQHIDNSRVAKWPDQRYSAQLGTSLGPIRKLGLDPAQVRRHRAAAETVYASCRANHYPALQINPAAPQLLLKALANRAATVNAPANVPASSDLRTLKIDLNTRKPLFDKKLSHPATGSNIDLGGFVNPQPHVLQNAIANHAALIYARASADVRTSTNDRHARKSIFGDKPSQPAAHADLYSANITRTSTLALPEISDIVPPSNESNIFAESIAGRHAAKETAWRENVYMSNTPTFLPKPFSRPSKRSFDTFNDDNVIIDTQDSQMHGAIIIPTLPSQVNQTVPGAWLDHWNMTRTFVDDLYEFLVRNLINAGSQLLNMIHQTSHRIRASGVPRKCINGTAKAALHLIKNGFQVTVHTYRVARTISGSFKRRAVEIVTLSSQKIKAIGAAASISGRGVGWTGRANVISEEPNPAENIDAAYLFPSSPLPDPSRGEVEARGQGITTLTPTILQTPLKSQSSLDSGSDSAIKAVEALLKDRRPMQSARIKSSLNALRLGTNENGTISDSYRLSALRLVKLMAEEGIQMRAMNDDAVQEPEYLSPPAVFDEFDDEESILPPLQDCGSPYESQPSRSPMAEINLSGIDSNSSPTSTTGSQASLQSSSLPQDDPRTPSPSTAYEASSQSSSLSQDDPRTPTPTTAHKAFSKRSSLPQDDLRTPTPTTAYKTSLQSLSLSRGEPRTPLQPPSRSQKDDQKTIEQANFPSRRQDLETPMTGSSSTPHIYQSIAASISQQKDLETPLAGSSPVQDIDQNTARSSSSHVDPEIPCPPQYVNGDAPHSGSSSLADIGSSPPIVNWTPSASTPLPIIKDNKILSSSSPLSDTYSSPTLPPPVPMLQRASQGPSAISDPLLSTRRRVHFFSSPTTGAPVDRVREYAVLSSILSEPSSDNSEALDQEEEKSEDEDEEGDSEGEDGEEAEIFDNSTSEEPNESAGFEDVSGTFGQDIDMADYSDTSSLVTFLSDDFPNIPKDQSSGTTAALDAKGMGLEAENEAHPQSPTPARQLSTANTPDTDSSSSEFSSPSQYEIPQTPPPSSSQPTETKLDGRSEAPRTPSPVLASTSNDVNVSVRRESQRQRALQARERERQAEDETRRLRAEEAERERVAAEAKAETERRVREVEEQLRLLGRRSPTNGVKLIVPLSREWEAKVETAMRSPMQRELARTSTGTALTRRDLGTLLPQAGSGDSANAWLNDDIIMGHLQATVDNGLERTGHRRGRTPQFHAFSSFFFKNLSERGPQSIGRWSSRAKITGKALLDVERVFIPINQSYHWTLMVVSPKLKLIEYFDSMSTAPGSGADKIRHIKKWLEQELKSDWVEADWRVEAGKSPQQDNASDCGVFTVTTARMIALGWDPRSSYSHLDMPTQRRRMAAELINGGLSGDFVPMLAIPPTA